MNRLDSNTGRVTEFQQYEINSSLFVADYILLLQLHPIRKLSIYFISNYLCMNILCWIFYSSVACVKTMKNSSAFFLQFFINSVFYFDHA